MFLTCSFCWLIADNSYGAAIHPGEPHHNVLGIVRRNLKEFTIIHNLRNKWVTVKYYFINLLTQFLSEGHSPSWQVLSKILQTSNPEMIIRNSTKKTEFKL